jgi:acyl-CoA dehydrogenase
VLAHGYQSLPIGITVEGANILTRSMIIFGQGAIRCHPFVQGEMASVAARDTAQFDRAFWGHIGLVFTNASRAFALSFADFLRAPVGGPAAPWFHKLSRYSAAFGFTADVAMGTLGASLKRKENLSGRLADALGWLYLGSAVLKRFVDDGQPERDLPAMRWAMQTTVHEIDTALHGLIDNHPATPVRAMLRFVLFPLGGRVRPPSDALSAKLARAILDDGAARTALTRQVFVPPPGEPGLGFLEAALLRVVAASGARDKIKDAQRAKNLPRGPALSVLARAVETKVLTAAEAELVRAAESARDAAVQVDSFANESAVQLAR